MRLITIALSCATLYAALSSCSSDSTEVDGGQETIAGGKVTAPDVVWPMDEARRAEAQPLNDFTLRLTRHLWQGADSSMVASPLSLAMALSMVVEGAEGETRDEVVKALGFAPDGYSALTDICASIQHGLSVHDDSLALELANACCLNRRYKLYEEYYKVMRDYYNADVSTMDFCNARAVASHLNAWCNEHTKGMVPQIISEDDIDERKVIFWLNAIYYKGLWSCPFMKENTRKEPFYRMSGSTTVTVPRSMMHQTHRLPYLRTDDFAAVELPYCGSRFVMTVVLPHNADGLMPMLSGMTAAKIAEIHARMKDREVALALPRFSVESSFADSLKTALQDMGAKRMFADAAQITNVSPDASLYVSLMLQKARMDVTEEGTEAAAATVIGGQKTGSGISAIFTATRPFLFYITDLETGLILFMGIYNG